MRQWTRSYLIGMRGGHVASGPRARIQVLEVQGGKRAPWPLHQSHLLLICLEGEFVVESGHASVTLSPGDQLLLSPGESFTAFKEIDDDCIGQFVWMPGISETD